MIGVIQLVGAYFSTFLLDRAGRKPLFVFSAFGIAVGMITFGVGIILAQNDSSETYRMVQVVGCSIAIFVANVGLSTMKFVIIGEISPSKVNNFPFFLAVFHKLIYSQIKSYVLTICMSCNWIFMFTAFNLMSPLSSLIGFHGVMFFYAINGLLGGLFVLYFVPETMGKSFAEIGRMMET